MIGMWMLMAVGWALWLAGVILERPMLTIAAVPFFLSAVGVGAFTV